MSIKIETVTFESRNPKDQEWPEYVKTLGIMKVGESFLTKMSSNHRNALSIAQYLLGRRYITRKEAGRFRVLRIEKLA
jgi:hypothetical protein